METNEHGLISSPNYPNTYPVNLNCYWTIHRPYNRIELNFLEFQLQQRNVDFVNITEGPFASSDLLLKERYGFGVPILYKEWADRWYWVHFRSDKLYAEKGFQAIYKIYEPRT